jgi:protein tyrosine phosphatase (PTP) superfamily phosphohydrolase (DUF442 family)
MGRVMGAVELDEIYNFLQIEEGWATAGQPTAEQFAGIKEAGYEVIINLGMNDSPSAIDHEDLLVAEQGLDYIAIPVVWVTPTHEDLMAFFAAMDAHAGKKRFVHCIANMRVSAFTYLYRVLVLGVPEAEAAATLHQIWQPNPIWQRFIDEQLQEFEQGIG